MYSDKNTVSYRKTNYSFTLIGYLLKLFLPVFFTAMIFFVLILELGDTFYNLVNYMENKVSTKTMLKIAILFIPKCISYAMPISMLFAGSYTLGNLYSKHELTVIFSSGISLQKFVMPILALAFACSVGMLIFEDRVVIKTLAKKTALLKTSTNNDDNMDSVDVAVMSNFGKVIYTADYYDSKNKFLQNPKIIHKDDNGVMDIVITARSANWIEEQGKWNLQFANMYIITDDNTVEFQSESNKALDFLTEPPESFQRISANIDEMNNHEAKLFLDKLKQNGFSSAEYLVKYYQRFSFPFTIFIVLFLSVPFGGYLKKNVLLMSLLLSLSFAVLYYVMQMCMAVFASWNLISPIVGAWIPFTLFFVLSIFFTQKART